MDNQQNEYEGELIPYPEYPKILVSRCGKLFNSRTMTRWYTRKNKDGYIYFQYCKEGKRCTRKVHRAVAECFIPLPEELNYTTEKYGSDSVVVKHKDNNKANNHYTNLTWGTNGSNIKDAYCDGLIPALKGIEHGMCKMTEEQVHQVCKIYFIDYANSKPPSTNAVAKMLGLTFKQVSKIRYRCTWDHITCLYPCILPNDYPEGEYTQASGNVEPSVRGEDIV